MPKAIMIVSGDSWKNSSYCRLHGPIVEDLLFAAGYDVRIYWTLDKEWTVQDILMQTPAVLVTLKAEDLRSHDLRKTLGQMDIPVISALNVRPAINRVVDLAGVTIATAAVYNDWIKELLTKKDFPMGRFRLIGDPPDTWLPNQAERLSIRESLPTNPRRLLWIGRARHLPSLEKWCEMLPESWHLDIWTDKPELSPLPAKMWDPAGARAALASADALLVTATDDNSAPIRLVNGLQTGCPVLAEPLTSYKQTCPPGYGWLSLNDPTSLTKILNKWDQEPQLAVRITNHITVPAAETLRAAHKAAWERLLEEALKV